MIDLSLYEELKQIPSNEYFRFAPLFFRRKFVGLDSHQFYFSDGSLIQNVAGFGVYNYYSAYFFKLQYPCSVFIAEPTALYFTCSLITNVLQTFLLYVQTV